MKLAQLFEQYKTDISLDDAAEMISLHCSDAEQYITTPLWRGMTGTNCFIIDSEVQGRVSNNTTNFYTIILDHILPPQFPRRSKSIICTNAKSIARDFTSQYTASSIYAIVPFNGSKIGIVPNNDIWALYVSSITTNRFGDSPSRMPLTDQNSEFAALGLDDTDWESFCQSLESFSKANPEKFNSKFMGRSVVEVIDHIEKSYGALDFEAATPANLREVLPSGQPWEVWIQGKCIAIPYDKFREYYDL